MFKLPRRRLDYSNPYSGKRKRRPAFSPFWFGVSLLSIPVFLILLEIIVRIFVGWNGKSEELAAYQGEPARVTASRLQFVTEGKQPIQGLSNRGGLLAQRSLATGYQLVGKQQNKFWQINEQGFRDTEPLPLAKPQNEIRVFVLGNSTAFGYWNLKNQETIANQLEVRLQARVAQQKQTPDKYQPDSWPIYWTELVQALSLTPRLREGQYRVINAAIPGYTSGNELAQLTLQILPYQPDLIVIIDGYSDLMSPSTEAAKDIPKVDQFLQDAPGHFGTFLGKSIGQWFADTYTVKALQYYLLKPEPNFAQKSLVNFSSKSIAQQLPADKGERERRVARYLQNHQQLVRFGAGANIPVIIAVQPEITGLSEPKLSPQEKEIKAGLGQEYLQQAAQDYVRFVQAAKQVEKEFPNNVKVLNLYNLDDKFPSPVFSDAVHLTPVAHKAIGNRLYNIISQWKKFQLTPKNAPQGR